MRAMSVRGILFWLSQWLFLVQAALYSTEHPAVDVVITWVNGQDPAWISERNEWAQREGRETIAVDGCADARFRDHDDLRYALRSVNDYAPWVRHIFIVTCGQRPKWLKEHSKITVVSHKEIFLRRRCLPTFNSHAIEANLHRIPGLSEHYVYMNDDFFFGRRSRFADFYSSNGDKMKVDFSRAHAIHPERPHHNDNGFIAGGKNTARLLNKHLGKRTRYHHRHTPYVQRKSFVEELERRFPKIFLANMSHRFRSLKDYTITNGLVPQAAYQLSRAEESTVSSVTVPVGQGYSRDRAMMSYLLHKDVAFFCFNDTMGASDERSRLLAHRFLEIYFNVPAPWENDMADVLSWKKYSRKERIHLFRASIINHKLSNYGVTTL